MALDKAIDSAQLDADLTAVADAIRAKGGTSEALAFPGGFVEAVEAIEAGGGGSDIIAALADRTITQFPYNELEGVVAIGENAFHSCARMQGTLFPSTVTSIGVSAFTGCRKIAFTELPYDIIRIGSYAFQDCNALALTTLPKIPCDGTYIGAYVFQNCYALAITELPTGVKGLSTSCFENCTGLESMYFPSSLNMGNNCFYGCTGLETVTFGATASAISSTAFKNCTALTTINVPWAEGEVANAPWGASNATINYNYTGEEET